MGWVGKKMYCDEIGIKFIHGVECYLTETLETKVRDNYHTILIAKNLEGIKELNQAISKSCDKEHFYYVNRITFDEFLQLSKNIVTTSACLASPLNKLSEINPYYEKLINRYDYLEIQPHTVEDQKVYNQKLLDLSKKYNKPLVAATDTHSSNKYKAECRKILLKAKNKSYGDEDTFDLTYKTYNEIIKAFEKQNCLPKEVFLEAIHNSNLIEQSVDDFELDKSLKYPILYENRDSDKKIFRETIDKKFKDKIDKGIIPTEQISAFKDAISEELRVFSKIEMDGFMLSMSELTSWCRNNNIPLGVARGSVGGSRVAYITDITDLNPETWHTVFSRFCNEDRKEVGDIDIDVIESDRPKIFKYIVSRFGTEKTARVPSFGTVVAKGTIDEIGRALGKYWHEKNPDKPNNPYSLSNIERIKKEFDSSEEKTRAKYPDIFYYFDGIIGTKVSQSVHPAGMVISPITLADNYGTFDKDGDNCLMIDMEEIHEIGLVKYDFLILKNVQIIRDTYNMLGKPYPTSHEIDWNDQEVWKDILRSPIGIFQMENEYSHSLLKQYKPHSIFDMSLVTAAIRPSGASYRNQLMQHIPYKNPSPIIDELLKDNNGYLIYQEDTIKFLQEICGLSGSDADNVRRAIGRKDEERLKKALPQILEGYCEKSNQSREIAEQEAKQFLKIIEDSASYQFGYNHAIAYCMMGYICAYLRYYYPYEFITSYLNNAANEDDVKNGSNLARDYKIHITPPKFGISSDKYIYNKNKKIISKGIASVKYLNPKVSIELFELSQIKTYDRFMNILLSLQNTSLDTRQLNILIRIGYFSDFGNTRELLKIVELFDFFKQGTAKSIKKDKLKDGFLKDTIAKYSTDRNKNGSEAKSYTIQDISSILLECENYVKSLNLEDLDIKLKMADQQEFLGYISSTGKEEDRPKLLIKEIYPLKRKKDGVQFGYSFICQSIGSGIQNRFSVMNSVYNKCGEVKANDIIYCTNHHMDNGYFKIDEYVQII